MTTWKLTINTKLWDSKQFINDYEELSRRQKTVPFSRGRAHMVVVPQPEDTVYVVCGGKRIMRGIVKVGFVYGTAHQRDPYNLGQVRAHAEPNWYAKVLITKIYKKPIDMRGNQRTWTQLR